MLVVTPRTHYNDIEEYEFACFEYQANSTHDNFWQRLKTAWKLIRGKDYERCKFEVYLTPEAFKELIQDMIVLGPEDSSLTVAAASLHRHLWDTPEEDKAWAYLQDGEPQQFTRKTHPELCPLLDEAKAEYDEGKAKKLP